MKIFIPFLLFFALSVKVKAQIGFGTITPDSSAVVDISSSNKGFLIPRVQLTATNLAAPVVNPATSLLVYNTATAGTSPNNVKPGFYYWDSTRWYPVNNKGNNIGDMQYWNGTSWVIIPIGPSNSVLTVCNGIPTWGPCPSNILTLSPANNPFEGIIDSYYSGQTSGSGITELAISAWTNGGVPENNRALIKFDYSALPANAVIDSAKLFLYSMPTPLLGNFIDAQFGPANAGYIRRITSTWSTPTQFSWSNQPTVTTVNQVILPQSTSSNENAVLNVTQLVKDMISSNNGFFMQLQNEVTYNIRQYASSYYSDAGKRPKLVIWYH
jgi:hypothetical protein